MMIKPSLVRPAIVAAIAACLLLSPPAQAQSLNNEIETYIVNPCVLAAVRYNDLDEMMDENEAATLMKILMADAISEMSTAVKDVLRGQSYDTRMALYPVMRGMCIENVIKGSD